MPDSLLSSAELDALAQAPLDVLRHVAGADSLVDSREWAALVGAVLASTGAEDTITREAMSALAATLEAGELPSLDGHDPLAALGEVRHLLASRPGGGYDYRETLLEIGAAIAESSGAQLTRTFSAHRGDLTWARSAGTSAVERAALEALREALGL